MAGRGPGTPNATFGKPTASATAPVTLTNAAGGTGAEIYYTTDGIDPRVANQPSDKATRYTAPIAITAANTILNFAAFKADDTFSDTGTAGPFQPSASAGLPMPGNVTVAGGVELATAKWDPVTGATKYVVTASPVAGAPPSATPVTVEAPAGTGPAQRSINQPLTAAVAPATGTTFDVRLRAGVPARPAQVWVKTSNGGVAGPFTVTNG